jgi:FlaA1/EpsC-like NDP-sugar epimerase
MIKVRRRIVLHLWILFAFLFCFQYTSNFTLQRKQLEMQKTDYDVIVIGAGVMGSSCAYKVRM